MKKIQIKLVITCILTIFCIALNAQNIDTTFYPKKAEDISNEVYRDYKKRLESTYAHINENSSKELSFHDYWNIAICYSRMAVDKKVIHDLLLKAKKADSSFFCEMINRQYDYKKREHNQIRFYKVLGDEYLLFLNRCKGIELEPESLEKLNAEKNKLDLEGLNESLIDRLIKLLIKDQTYRYSHTEYEKNREKQHKLDREVEKELISIFEEFGYPSKDLVGDHYATLSCLLLEHSGQPKTQEKYIPMVAEAFKTNKKIKPYFTMLLDRYYMRTTGTQIFGSHQGIPFADDDAIVEVKRKYGFSLVKSNSVITQNSKTIIIKKQ